MLKIDRSKSNFDCSLCNKMKVDPNALVCGCTIRKSHIDHHPKQTVYVYQSISILISFQKITANSVAPFMEIPIDTLPLRRSFIII